MSTRENIRLNARAPLLEIRNSIELLVCSFVDEKACQSLFSYYSIISGAVTLKLFR